MKVCSISDVHVTDSGELPEMTPEADVLTISGDLTMRGAISELTRFRWWLIQQPQKYKVVIAGNHDFCFENKRQAEAEVIVGGNNITYLRDQSTTIEGFKFYGTPWQPWFHDWAFNLQRGQPIAEKWALIPNDVDVLLVHGPPHGFGDLTIGQEHVGCEDLLKSIDEKSPRVVCFGHIHESTGVWRYKKSLLANCSVGYRVTVRDRAPRVPFVFEITKEEVKVIAPVMER